MSNDVAQPVKVVFCLPGNEFSGRFLECWTGLVSWCQGNGIVPLLSRQYSCNVYYSRELCLGGDVLRGPHQEPFNGEVDYDYLMWIDSDMVFTWRHFLRLLCHEVDIVSGVYLMADGRRLATVAQWDEDYFRQRGHFRFMNLRELGEVRSTTSKGGGKEKDNQGGSQLIEVAYTGMGFMLIRKGVFERLGYPWFPPLRKRIGTAVSFTMEDVGFCLRAREAGYQVLIDPDVVLGHEKSVVIGPSSDGGGET